MILTVTPNPAIDRTFTVPGFALGEVNRPTETLVTAGGKGVNVARAFQTLGGEARTTGFLGGANGEKLLHLLDREAISGDWIKVHGETRVCFQFYDPQTAALTELNENGPEVSDADCVALTARIKELLAGCQAVIFSGSLPPGAPPTLYRDWILSAQEIFKVPAVLDTSGEALVSGITAQPFLVKPNANELRALGFSSRNAAASAQSLREKFGSVNVLVTDGPRGAVLATAQGVWEAVPSSIDVVSALGSGDSVTAAFVWAWLAGHSWPDILKTAVAAGAANALSLGAASFSRAQVDLLAAQVTVRCLSGKA